jgi:hypothetical protein
MGYRIGADRFVVGRPKGKRPLGRLERRCQDNIKMCIQKVEWGVMDRIVLVQNSLLLYISYIIRKTDKI